jgi:penicillin-binding protein 1B
VDAPGGVTWQPSNFDGEVHGPVPLVRALAESLNLATVRLGLDVGLDRVADRIGELAGRRTANRYPSLLLGAEPMSPLDITRLYGNFASGGFYMAPKAVTSVLGENGDLLATVPIEVRQTIDGARAAAVTGALEIAMREGTGASSRFARAGVAGKTGTSDDYRDSWFAGFDDAHVAVVWIGHDDNSPTGLSGATGALRVWEEIMVRAHVEPLVLSPAHTVDVDFATGLLANEDCSPRVARINVPEDTVLRVAPGCDISPPRQSLSDRFKSWFRD